MPNGSDNNERLPYNSNWCNERHKNLDKKLEKIETWFQRIILLLVGNLCAASATFLMLYIKG